MVNPFINLPPERAPIGGAPLPPGLRGGTLPLDLTRPAPSFVGTTGIAGGGAPTTPIPTSNLGVGIPSGIPSSSAGPLYAAGSPAAQYAALPNMDQNLLNAALGVNFASGQGSIADMNAARYAIMGTLGR